jgi:hypothetical protein
VFRHSVKSKDGLVGVLNQDVLALIHLETHVDDSTNNGPSVVEIECHLVGEVTGLVSEDTEDDVIIVVLRVCSGNESRSCQQASFVRVRNLTIHIPKLHGIGLGEDALYCPSGQLARVVFHFGCKNSTSLTRQLSAPI